MLTIEDAKARQVQIKTAMVRLHAEFKSLERFLDTGIFDPPTRKRLRGDNLINAIGEMLAVANHPMPVGEIIRRLETEGWTIGAYAAQSNMTTKLKTVREFVRIEGLGWWAKNRKYEPAGYVMAPESWKFSPEDYV